MARKPLPESEKKVPLNSRVFPSLFSRLKRLADADERTMSFMVEKAVREFCDRAEAKSPRRPK